MAEQHPGTKAEQVAGQRVRDVERANIYGEQPQNEFWGSLVANVAIITVGTLLVAWLLGAMGAAPWCLLVTLVSGGSFAVLGSRSMIRVRRAGLRWVRQTRIKELEGELGLPVVMVGECWNCHKPLPAEAKFCTYCGKTAKKPSVTVCATCQARNPLDGVFCMQCGQRLPAAL